MGSALACGDGHDNGGRHLLQPAAMTRLLSLLLLSATRMAGSASLAGETHLNGHSYSSDTEAAGR